MKCGSAETGGCLLLVARVYVSKRKLFECIIYSLYWNESKKKWQLKSHVAQIVIATHLDSQLMLAESELFCVSGRIEHIQIEIPALKSIYLLFCGQIHLIVNAFGQTKEEKRKKSRRNAFRFSEKSAWKQIRIEKFIGISSFALHMTHHM